MYPMTPCGTVWTFRGAGQGLEPCARSRVFRIVVQRIEGQSLGPVGSQRIAVSGHGDRDREVERYSDGDDGQHQATFSQSFAAYAQVTPSRK